MSSSNDSAAVLKERGNLCFKNWRLDDAVKLYQQAEELEAEDPVYPSNLSAALYEIGDYAECARAIFRCLKRLSAKPNADLYARLSMRLAKALAHGASNGSITLRMLEDEAEAISHLRELTVHQEKATPELIRLWKGWDATRSRSVIAHDVMRMFSQLPIFKRSFDPTLEYYSIGHDDIMSIVDDWGPRDPSPLHLHNYDSSRLSNVAFLFGGVGDARHVLGSIIGLHRVWDKLDEAQRQNLHIHMTLLDIHPTALARDLLVLVLLKDLLEISESSTEHNMTERVEIQATLFYVYAGVIMPSYCYDRLQKTINQLHTQLSTIPPMVPSWLHVDQMLVQRVREVFSYWMTLPNYKSTRDTLIAHQIPENQDFIDRMSNSNIAPGYLDAIKNHRQEQKAQLLQMFAQLDDETLKSTPRGSEITAAEIMEMIASDPDGFAETLLDKALDPTATGDMRYEQEWYKATKVFLPPAPLWDRHPHFDAAKKLKDDMHEGLDPTLQKKIRAHIENNWVPNVTLFDKSNSDNYILCPSGFPDLKFNAFKAVHDIIEFNERFSIEEQQTDAYPDSPAFLHTVHLFDAVVDALRSLGDHLKLEMIHGDVTQRLLQMRCDNDYDRPAEFPRFFTRIWLSNVPDYTHGIMNMALYVLPHLLPDREALCGANCLLNTGVWKNEDEYFHTYTLLHPEDIDRYLGCRVIQKDVIHGIIVMGSIQLPRHLSELASRQELTTWLTRVLLNTIIPGNPGLGSFRVRLPNNLVAFIRLLIHLQDVGFPSHWLSDFLQTILSNGLSTDITPYGGQVPIPLSDMKHRVKARRLNLHPWQAELEMLLATSEGRIPFHIHRPEGFAASFDKIATFEATIRQTLFNMSTVFNPVSPFDQVACLLFYRSIGKIDIDEFVADLPSILEGRKHPRIVGIQILTTQDDLDLPGKLVRWKMSKERIRKMKEEQWSMLVYRIDTWQIVAHACAVSGWKAV